MDRVIEFFHWYKAAGYPCLMHGLTGYYCPGCGGTRSVMFLLTGHPLMSFVYHPLVLYAVAVAMYIFVRHIVDLVRHRGLRQRYLTTRMLWVALIIVLVNFVIKNLALILLHIDLLK